MSFFKSSIKVIILIFVLLPLSCSEETIEETPIQNGTPNDSDETDPGDVSDGSTDGTDNESETETENDSPGNVLGLTLNNWKLNGFTGSPDFNAVYEDNLLQAINSNYDSYSDLNYFYTDGEWTYFKCYRGLGGSANSNNPRVELRELSNGNNVYWDGGTGNNTMTFTVKVDRLPQDTDNNGGVLCFAQIHGPSNTVDDVIRVQFLGDENQTTGSVRLKISGYITEDVQNSSLIIDDGYQLGTSYTFTISYNNGTVKLFKESEEIFSEDIGTDTSGNYFKVGNYLQSVQGAAYTGSHGIVGIKDLSITH
jgi:hypothetical protein